jgi:hypothetical protein
MRHHTQSGSGKQIPLALNLMASPEITSVLRTAYTRLELSRRLSFEQVMADRVYAIGVRNLADAIVRRKAPGNSTKGTPTTSKIGKAMDPVPEFRPEINYSGAEKGDR